MTKKKSSKIILNEHQKYVSEYMLNKCSNQNGLILFHMMGTGKTISSLNFIKNVKKKNYNNCSLSKSNKRCLEKRD